jgi:ribosome-associated protein
MAKLPITSDVALDESELTFRFIAAAGPGGQNVNKVATAVQLRFDARRTPSLDEATRERLQRLAGSRLTLHGEIVIHANRFRTQERNRADAVERLAELIRQSLVAPKRRRPTRPTRASKERRLESKTRRSGLKAGRRANPSDD